MITSAPIVLYPSAPEVQAGGVVPAGPPGASAYQLAVGAGFAGSVADWLASLVGPVGPPASAAALAAAVTAAVGGAGLLPATAAALGPLLTTVLAALPTAPDGLASGALWLNGGQVTVALDAPASPAGGAPSATDPALDALTALLGRLPTSGDGLAPGTLYLDGGLLAVKPGS